MNVTLIRGITGILALSTSTYASAYKFEVGGSYSQVSVDLGAVDLDADIMTLNGKVHFSSINSSGNPMAEEAYLAKSNNFQLTHFLVDTEDGDTSYDLARLEFYIPDAMLYLAPYYVYYNFDFNGEDLSYNTYGVSLGITPTEGLRVFTTWNEDIDYEINFDVKYVTELGDDNALNIELSYAKAEDAEFDDSDDQIGLGFDFYFDPSFSVGAFYYSNAGGYTVFNNNTFFIGEKTIGLRSEKYLNDTVALYGNYFTSDEVDGWEFGVNCRF